MAANIRRHSPDVHSSEEQLAAADVMDGSRSATCRSNRGPLAYCQSWREPESVAGSITELCGILVIKIHNVVCPYSYV